MTSLNLNVSGLPKSATLAINERCRALRAQGETIYDFGLGQSPFPVPEPVRRALQENAHQKDYLPVEGLRSLRDAVAAYHSRRNRCDHRGDHVLVGPGSKELMFLIQLVYYGDLVIPTPSWVSYAPQARIIGRQVNWLPTRPEDNWMLSAETLDEHCRADPERPRIVILNYPSNPTGATLSSNELTEIAEVARRYGVVLLSDEIYGELHHRGEHTSIACHYPEGTIISGGLSKWCGAGGWRLGYFVFPPEHVRLGRAVAVAASETFTSTSAPIQYAAVAAYQEDPRLREYLENAREVLSLMARWATRKLNSVDVTLPRVDGAFYLFPDFSRHREALAARSITDSRGLCEHLLDRTGVAALPGEAFGCPANDLSIRMAYVDFEGGRALEAVSEFLDSGGDDAAFDEEAFLAGVAPRVVEGIERLVDEVARW